MKRINQAVKFGTGAALAALATTQAFAVDYSTEITKLGADTETNGGAMVAVVVGLAALGIVIGLIRRNGK